MKPKTVFLDANVLYSAGLRDLLIRLALHDLFRIKWSDRVHEEWMRNLLAKRPDLIPEKLERTRRLMVDGVPDSLVKDYEPLIEHITLPDPDDRHVLAAAITGQASVILTFNLKDFPQSLLRPYKIEAQHPDKFLCRLLRLKPDPVCTALRQTV
jgi:predicted nucleic acid-binding protein